MILQATIRESDPSGSDQGVVITAKSDTYQDAYARLQPKVPEGWVIVFVRSL